MSQIPNQPSGPNGLDLLELAKELLAPDGGVIAWRRKGSQGPSFLAVGRMRPVDMATAAADLVLSVEDSIDRMDKVHPSLRLRELFELGLRERRGEQLEATESVIRMRRANPAGGGE